MFFYVFSIANFGVGFQGYRFGAGVDCRLIGVSFRFSEIKWVLLLLGLGYSCFRFSLSSSGFCSGCTLKVDIECFSYWGFITLLSIVESYPSLRIKKVSL